MTNEEALKTLWHRCDHNDKTYEAYCVLAEQKESCEDAVSREELKNKLVGVPIAPIFRADDTVVYRKAVFAEEIDKLPSVQPEPKWIPCSERLPENGDYVLCCDKKENIAIGLMSNWGSYWCFDDDTTDMDVIAWMPLPEPYKKRG